MSKKPQTKEEFIRQLRWQLRRLPKEEVNEAVIFYQEYLDEAGEENLQGVMDNLGSPREIAMQILADRSFAEMQSSPPSVKKGVSAMWVVILAILASPVALPIAIAGAVIAFALALVVFFVVLSLLIALFSVLIAFLAASIGSIVGGVFYLCLSMPLLFQNPAIGFFYLGTGLCAFGLGMLLLPPIIFLVKKLWKLAVHVFGHKIPEFISKQLARRKENDQAN